jgi:hypothetical protein
VALDNNRVRTWRLKLSPRVVGDADAARIRDPFEAGGNVDAVAKESFSSMMMSPMWMPIRLMSGRQRIRKLRCKIRRTDVSTIVEGQYTALRNFGPLHSDLKGTHLSDF